MPSCPSRYAIRSIFPYRFAGGMRAPFFVSSFSCVIRWRRGISLTHLVSSFVSLARLVGRLVAILLICPSGRLVVLVNSLGGSLSRLVKQSAFSRLGLSSRFSSCGIGSCSPSCSHLISFVASHSRRDGVGSSFSSRGGVPSSPLPPRRGIRLGPMAAVGMNAPFSSARFLIRRGRWR